MWSHHQSKCWLHIYIWFISKLDLVPWFLIAFRCSDDVINNALQDFDKSRSTTISKPYRKTHKWLTNPVFCVDEKIICDTVVKPKCNYIHIQIIMHTVHFGGLLLARLIQTVCSNSYSHRWCIVVFRWGQVSTNLPINSSWFLPWRWNSETTLMNMCMYTWYNHNQTQYNKTVRIFNGISTEMTEQRFSLSVETYWWHVHSNTHTHTHTCNCGKLRKLENDGNRGNGLIIPITVRLPFSHVL